MIKNIAKNIKVILRKICFAIPPLRFLLKSPMTLILIRHAESERNKFLNGALFVNDPSTLEKIGKVPDHKITITEDGMIQVVKTSPVLYSKYGMPDVVFHSGYTRTRQTAEGVLSAYPKPAKYILKEDLSLRERESGYTHTLLENDKNKHFPYLQEYWDIVGGLFARPVGGESLMDVIENRLRPFFLHLNNKFSGKTVFLVTHGKIIQASRFILDEMSWNEMDNFLGNDKKPPKNCSITVYKYDTSLGKLKLEEWNQTYW